MLTRKYNYAYPDTWQAEYKEKINTGFVFFILFKKEITDVFIPQYSNEE